MSELLLTDTREKYITTQMGLSSSEQKLIWRLRQLRKEQCRGAFVRIVENGFELNKFSQCEKLKD